VTSAEELALLRSAETVAAHLYSAPSFTGKELGISVNGAALLIFRKDRYYAETVAGE
jgi:hypothetical protein